MKKKFSSLLAILSALTLTITLLSGCGSKTTNLSTTTNNGNTLVKVRLNEVARSIFYAPFYAAMNQGFFKEQGLEIDLTTGQGAVLYAHSY